MNIYHLLDVTLYSEFTDSTQQTFSNADVISSGWSEFPTILNN